MKPRTLDYEFPADQLDSDAVFICERLQEHGEQALLVGGCIRDVMRGKIPKDFDVITSATPRQIRRCFRNSRQIGRRFKLVHVFWGKKVIEVTTFRAPEPDAVDPRTGDGAETFGDAESDALLRDFTINAIYYDPVESQLIDYVDGVSDLEQGVLRAIGDPDARVPEDPVRILRGVRYAAAVDLDLDPATEAAFHRHRGLVPEINASRLREEVYKFLRTQGTAEAFEMLLDIELLDPLLPGISRFVEPNGQLLEDLDEKDNLPAERLDNSLLWALLFLSAFDELPSFGTGSQEAELRHIGEVIELLAEPLAVKHNIARRERYIARQLLESIPRLRRGPGGRNARLARQSWLPEALDLYELFCRARGQEPPYLFDWQHARVAAIENEEVEPERLPFQQRKRRRRRHKSANA